MGIAQLQAVYPINRILCPLGVVQLEVGIQPLGLISNPIGWTRNRRVDMAAEADGRQMGLTDSAIVRRLPSFHLLRAPAPFGFLISEIAPYPTSNLYRT